MVVIVMIIFIITNQEERSYNIKRTEKYGLLLISITIFIYKEFHGLSKQSVDFAKWISHMLYILCMNKIMIITAVNISRQNHGKLTDEDSQLEGKKAIRFIVVIVLIINYFSVVVRKYNPTKPTVAGRSRPSLQKSHSNRTLRLSIASTIK